MKKTLSVLLVAMLLILAMGCAPAAAPAAEAPAAAVPATEEAVEQAPKAEIEKVTIKLGHGSSPAEDDPYHVLATLFANYVSEATDGNVTVEIYSGGQLGGEMDSYEGLGMGTVDMCIATANIFGEYYNKTTIMDLPFLFADEEAAHKLLDSEIVAGLMTELSDVTNAVHLGWGEGGFRNIFNNVRPIYTPADLAGVKLRVPETTIFVSTFSALGANVTPMTYSECYTAISQGTIDGIEVPVGNGYTVGFYEVCDYYSLSHHFYNALSLSIGRDLYNSFSPELQQILMDCAVRAGNEQRAFVAANQAKQLSLMEEAGLKVNDINDINEWRTLCQSIYDNYRSNIDADVYEKTMTLLGIQG